MSGDSLQSTSAQEPQPVQSPGKKGMGKAIVIIAVVAIIIIAAIAVSLMSSPSIVGKWGLVSQTMITGDTQVTDWKNDSEAWIEFRKDGTGVSSDGERFNWETVNGQLRLTGILSVPVIIDFSIRGRELTLDATPFIWVDIAAAAAEAGIEGGIGSASLDVNTTVLVTYRRM